MNILKVKPVFVSTICILVFGIVFGTLPNSNLFPNITITPFYVQLNNTGGTVKFIGIISPKTVGQNLSNFTYHWFLSSSYGAPNSTIVSGCEVNELNCTVSVPLTSKTTYFFLQLYAQNKTGATLGPSSYIKEKINNTQTTTTTTIPTTINTTTTSSTTTSTTTTGSTTTSPWSQPINITIGHPINYEGWVITLDSYNQNYTATFTVSYNGSSRNLTVAHLTATETSVDNGVHILQIYNINNLSNYANNGGVIIELSSLVNNVSISTTSTTSTTTTGSTTTSPWSQSINITIGHPINYEGWVITLDSYNQNYTAIFTVSHGGSSSNLTMVIGMASTTSVDNGVYEIEIDYLSKFSNGAVISLITFVNNPPTPSTSSNSTQFPNNTEVILNIRKGWNLLSVPAGNNNAQKFYSQLQDSCGMSNGQKLWGYSNIGNSYQWINNPTYGGINAFENYATYSFNNTLTTSGGGGFWFFSTKQCSITLQALSLTFIQQQNSLGGRNLNVTLFKGWNVIGVPILTNNDFNSMLNSCSIKGGFYTYDPLTSTYVNTTTPTVGLGYFVYANAQCTLDWTQNVVNSSSPPSAP